MYLEHSQAEIRRTTQFIPGMTGLTLLRALISACKHYWCPQPVLKKPDWVHLSDRTWNRRSAFIMSHYQNLPGLNQENLQ